LTSCSAAPAPVPSTSAALAGLVGLKACLDKARNGTATFKSLGLPFENAAPDNDTDDIGSIVARLAIACARPVVLPGAAQAGGAGVCGAAAPGGGAGGAGAAALVVPPGNVFQVQVVVEDWQGSRIESGFDSGLVLQVGSCVCVCVCVCARACKRVCLLARACVCVGLCVRVRVSMCFGVRV
jgi:hypothetical protein